MFVVHVRLVELEHRELGIVLRRDPLVPEVTVDLVHPFEAADGQALEIQLRRDPQIQVEVERVVMRHERARQRASRDRLHHRRLDFEEPAVVQELPNRRHDARARLEHLPGLGIDDQVEVPLPVAHFDVGQSMPLLGQRHPALGEELDVRRPDRQLVGPCAKHAASDADVVAQSRAA